MADEERFTSQKRINAGNNNANRELYYYGARWYLPGVGIFTQPDSIVPDYKNPQALNRYSYGYNNPVKHVDPDGHDPRRALTVTPVPAPTPGPTPTPLPAVIGPVAAQATPGPAPAPTPTSRPSVQASSNPASSSNSAPSFRALVSKTLIDAFGSPATMFMGGPISLGQTLNSSLGVALGEWGGGRRRTGPGGSLVYENVGGLSRDIIRGLNNGQDAAITLGNVIVNSSSFDQSIPLGAQWMAHEHAHVGQAGALGILYLPAYGALYLLSGPVHDEHPMEFLANQYRDDFWQEYQVQPSGQAP